jgi:hypothetical protein
MKLPVFKMMINKEDTSAQAVDYVALVDQPAIETNWMAFDKQYKFSADNDRRLIMGPLMIADMPIVRHGVIPFTQEVGDYYVLFDKATVYDIAEKFFRNGNTSNFNMMHDSNKRTEGVYMIESFIVDSSRGVSAPKAFEGISEGSWIATIKVDNDEIWNDFIKTGKVKGFSVEGIFSPQYENTEDERILQTIADMVKP